MASIGKTLCTRMSGKCAALLLLVLTSSVADCADHGIEIKLKHGNAEELKAKDQLQRLLGEYDVSAYYFTKEVIIEQYAIPL